MSDAITVTNPVADRWPITGRYLDTTPPTWSAVRPHLGVDFGAPLDANVVSCTKKEKVIGVYSAANPLGDGSFGTCIVTDVIGTPWYFLYAHLSQVLVTVGQELNPEDLIGRVGATGFVTGAHLHIQKSKDKAFPRDLAVIGDPMEGYTPEPRLTQPPTLDDVTKSLKNLSDVVGKQGVDNASRDANLDSRLAAIERGIQALVQALPKG